MFKRPTPPSALRSGNTMRENLRRIRLIDLRSELYLKE